jgi:hypothetical protein
LGIRQKLRKPYKIKAFGVFFLVKKCLGGHEVGRNL